jgi:hypothetical protein
MGSRAKAGQRLARVLAVALALFFVLFLSQAVSHSHLNGGSEAACHTCHAAHVGLVSQAGTQALESLLLATGYVQPFLLALHEELFFHDSPSRAPPAA